MLKLSASLMNLKVLSLRTNGTVAIAAEPIINPHNLRILGWWCQSPMSPSNLVLLASDVRDRSASELAINDEEDLSDPAELVRHKDILDINFELIGKTVKTKRHKLGKVNDYSYTEDMLVRKLYVERPITKVFAADDTLIIDRSQIIEVTNNWILVKDTDIKAGETSRIAVPAA
ncbi:MAG TPA: hypothetical protein VFP35_00880 [Candidatus Saccharimonadales bacterium]|nr:hypothetical protein [Candidatus Saccharimonadales bacterium]